MTWNPIRGCSRVSPGCDHCFAKRIAARFRRYTTRDECGEIPGLPFAGYADANGWTGRVGRKAAGRLLDGREWSQMPEVAA